MDPGMISSTVSNKKITVRPTGPDMNLARAID
jgi:hypothetical protein